MRAQLAFNSLCVKFEQLARVVDEANLGETRIQFRKAAERIVLVRFKIEQKAEPKGRKSLAVFDGRDFY